MFGCPPPPGVRIQNAKLIAAAGEMSARLDGPAAHAPRLCLTKPKANIESKTPLGEINHFCLFAFKILPLNLIEKYRISQLSTTGSLGIYQFISIPAQPQSTPTPMGAD